MTQETIKRVDVGRKTPRLDLTVKLIKPLWRFVMRATEKLSDVCAIALVLIAAMKKSITHRRTDDYIEQLREYGDWVDWALESISRETPF